MGHIYSGVSEISRLQSRKAKKPVLAPSSSNPTGPTWNSWVVISGVISRVTVHIRGLITLLITTHEPPSSAVGTFW